jgi:hypothetical protein
LDYTGLKCPVCKNEFTENDDIVVCPVCGTPHHRECYASLGDCANADKHAEGFVFETGERKTRVERLFAELGMDGKESDDTSSAETEKAFGEEDENEDGQNIYSPFSAFAPDGTLKDLGIDIAGIPFNEVVRFVGDDPASKRLILNISFVEKLHRLRINIVAFFLPYIWLFYRKMYKLGVLFIVLTVLSSVAFTNRNTVDYTKKVFDLYMSAFTGEMTIDQLNVQLEEIQEKGTGNSYYYDIAPQIISLVLRLVVALFANKWYLEHMKKQVMKTREKCSSMDEYMAALAVRGGKSVPAAIIGVALFAALNFAYQFVIIQLF